MSCISPPPVLATSLVPSLAASLIPSLTPSPAPCLPARLLLRCSSCPSTESSLAELLRAEEEARMEARTGGELRKELLPPQGL